MICGKYRSPFSFDKHISFIIKTATKTSCLPNALRKVPRTKNIIKSAFASWGFFRHFSFTSAQCVPRGLIRTRLHTCMHMAWNWSVMLLCANLPLFCWTLEKYEFERLLRCLTAASLPLNSSPISDCFGYENNFRFVYLSQVLILSTWLLSNYWTMWLTIFNKEQEVWEY